MSIRIKHTEPFLWLWPEDVDDILNGVMSEASALIWSKNYQETWVTGHDRSYLLPDGHAWPLPPSESRILKDWGSW